MDTGQEGLAMANPNSETERLRAENFALAADQCHAGYGDDYGNHRCREVDKANARVDELMCALKFVGPGLLVLRDMLGTAGLTGGRAKASEMIEAVRKALEPDRLTHP